MLPFVFALVLAPAVAGDPPSPPPAEEEEVADLDAEEGWLPDGAVAEVFQKNDWAVTDCVKRNASSSLDGRLEFAWEITIEGKVDKLKVKESTIRNPPLQECLQKAVQRLTFPKPRGGVVKANHAFSF